MTRRILGALAATIAAPCMAFFLWGLGELLFNMEWSLQNAVELPFSALIVGMIASLLYGVPLFMITYVLGSLAHHWKREDRWIAIFMGGIVGLCYSMLLFSLNLGERILTPPTWLFYLPYVASGCISGWIYWRIAVAHQMTETDLY